MLARLATCVLGLLPSGPSGDDRRERSAQRESVRYSCIRTHSQTCSKLETLGHPRATRRRDRTIAFMRARQQARARAAAEAASARQKTGVGYWLGRTLAISLTNESNATSLLAARGPGYEMPSTSGFAPLAEGYEPSVAEVIAFVEKELHPDGDGWGGDGALLPDAFAFAGVGEPLLRLEVLVEAASILAGRWAVPLRLTTNGLVLKRDAGATAKRLRDSGITFVSVELATSEASEYLHRMQPCAIASQSQLTTCGPGATVVEPVGHADVCTFTRALTACGVEVECTAVAAPEVWRDPHREGPCGWPCGWAGAWAGAWADAWAGAWAGAWACAWSYAWSCGVSRMGHGRQKSA